MTSFVTEQDRGRDPDWFLAEQNRPDCDAILLERCRRTLKYRGCDRTGAVPDRTFEAQLEVFNWVIPDCRVGFRDRLTEIAAKRPDALVLLCTESGDEALVKNWRPRIMPMLLRFLRETEEARDAAQEVTMHLLTSPGRSHLIRRILDNPERWGFLSIPFLHRSAKNEAYDRLRKRGDGPVEVPLGHSALDEDGPTAVLDWPDTGDVPADVLLIWTTAWEGLTEEVRKLLEMRYVDGLSIEEIAKILRVDKRTVSVRLYRAEKRFRAAFGE